MQDRIKNRKETKIGKENGKELKKDKYRDENQEIKIGKNKKSKDNKTCKKKEMSDRIKNTKDIKKIGMKNGKE